MQEYGGGSGLSKPLPVVLSCGHERLFFDAATGNPLPPSAAEVCQRGCYQASGAAMTAGQGQSAELCVFRMPPKDSRHGASTTEWCWQVEFGAEGQPALTTTYKSVIHGYLP